MAEPVEERIFEVEEDGTVVPLFGPPPFWLRAVAFLAGACVFLGIAVLVFGGALATGGALSWDWPWFGGWLALGGVAIGWVADRAAPVFRSPR